MAEVPTTAEAPMLAFEALDINASLTVYLECTGPNLFRYKEKNSI